MLSVKVQINMIQPQPSRRQMSRITCANIKFQFPRLFRFPRSSLSSYHIVADIVVRAADINDWNRLTAFEHVVHFLCCHRHVVTFDLFRSLCTENFAVTLTWLTEAQTSWLFSHSSVSIRRAANNDCAEMQKAIKLIFICFVTVLLCAF